MALVRYNHVIAFPVEVLIPMRLIVYNGGGRKLILRGGEQELAAPIAAWLQTAVEHNRLVATVEAVAAPADASASSATAETDP